MKRVGVLMGGPSSEHDISLLSGMNVMRALAGRYEAIPILISKSGAWLFGRDKQWVNPAGALGHVDVVFNALHGEYGEDGTVQNILSHFQIPYTGSEALPSALAMNKIAAQKILESVGITMPRSLVMGPYDIDTRTVLSFSPPPWIVKPVSRGSSVGVSRASTREGLLEAFRKALAVDKHIIVQEYIPGREVTCGVLECFDGKPLAALLPVEIIPPKDADFFDYQVKYNGRTEERCSPDFHGAMLANIMETAIRAHTALGLRHYSRTDMIIKSSDKTRRAPELYVLEVNTLPGFTRESLFPKAAHHAGLEFPALIRHLISLA